MTIKDIARLAGVSPSTVSKIVNNKDKNINSKTRSKVLAIVKEYNYTPYGTVKMLNSPKSFKIAVLINKLSELSLIRGIISEAAQHGYNILLYESNDSEELELKNITSACSSNVDGVIWEIVSENSLRHEHYFESSKIEICHINQAVSQNGFAIDFEDLGYKMTEELLKNKHSNIACLLDKKDAITDMIANGYKKCLFNNHLVYDSHRIIYADIPDILSKVIAKGISGLICSSYPLALTFYEGVNNIHYRIPYNFSLICLKSDGESNESYPHLSSIPVPYEMFGKYLAQFTIAKCEQDETDVFPKTFSAKVKSIAKNTIDIPFALRSKKIIVVGSINMDITYNVDFLPQAGKTTQIINSSSALGGKGSNQSIGVARLNHEVTLIGEIGNDLESDFIFDFLNQEKVGAEGIKRNLKSETGKAYIYPGSNGETAIAVLPGANEMLSKRDIDGRKYLFDNTGYCLLSTEIPINAVITAAKYAKDAGATTILKPAALKQLPMELLRCTDIFVPNRKEAEILCPFDCPLESQAEYFHTQGIPIVLITLGHEGCFLKTKTLSNYFAASSFDPTDTTGGADAFIAALATYLINGYTLETAVQIANYAAGFCISRRGVVQSLVNKNTLEAYIKRVDPLLLN